MDVLAIDATDVVLHGVVEGRFAVFEPVGVGDVEAGAEEVFDLEVDHADVVLFIVNQRWLWMVDKGGREMYVTWKPVLTTRGWLSAGNGAGNKDLSEKGGVISEYGLTSEAAADLDTGKMNQA